jgi:hypothetical protein
MTTSQVQLPVGFTSEDVPGCCHACWIYDDDSQRKRIVSRFLGAGLENGELVSYSSDGTTGKEIRAWLDELGVAIPKRDGRESLSIADETRAYTSDKPFSPHETVDRMRRVSEAATAAGFTALRSTGEMSWVLRGMPGSERWLEYEALLNTLHTPGPRLGICQYDARRFDGAALFKVLQVHPYMIAHGQIVRNPCYVAPETSPVSAPTKSEGRSTQL